MPQESFDALRVLDLAAEIERRGHAFYSQWAQRIASEKGQAIFSRLAGEELMHLEWVLAQRRSLERQGHWLPEEQVPVVAQIKSLAAFVFPQVDSPRAGVSPEATELEALRRGIQAEKDSVVFYSDAHRRAADPQAQSMFARLVQVEQGHQRLLEAEADYLSKSGFYFGEAEFIVEGPD